MKRIATLVILALLVFSMLPFSTFAAKDNSNYDEIIYLDNGDYITVEISQTASRATTVKNSKTYTYRNNSGDELWRAVLSGTFTYNGSTATCTASSCDVTISNSAWSVSSKTVGKSGGTATTELTMVKKFIGITIDTETLSMSLTCSPTGVFS